MAPSASAPGPCNIGFVSGRQAGRPHSERIQEYSVILDWCNPYRSTGPIRRLSDVRRMQTVTSRVRCVAGCSGSWDRIRPSIVAIPIRIA